MWYYVISFEYIYIYIHRIHTLDTCACFYRIYIHAHACTFKEHVFFGGSWILMPPNHLKILMFEQMPTSSITYLLDGGERAKEATVSSHWGKRGPTRHWHWHQMVGLSTPKRKRRLCEVRLLLRNEEQPYLGMAGFSAGESWPDLMEKTFALTTNWSMGNGWVNGNIGRKFLFEPPNYRDFPGWFSHHFWDRAIGGQNSQVSTMVIRTFGVSHLFYWLIINRYRNYKN